MTDLTFGELLTQMGTLGVVADRKVVRRIYFVKNRDQLRDNLCHEFPNLQPGPAAGPLVVQALKQLKAFFAAELCCFDLPLASDKCSSFAQQVRQVLCRVPYGEVISYSALADRSGSPGAARAVGTVMATNPYPIVIPCHRVIRADGSLGEYSAAFGILTKRHMIDFEAAHKTNVNAALQVGKNHLEVISEIPSVINCQNE